MTCPVCHYPLIPGIAHCVQCGEPAEESDGPLDFVMWQQVEGIEPTGDVDVDIARWQAENTRARAYQRAITEAQCLEYASDTAGALAIYEQLIRLAVPWSAPYQRCAIIYRRARNRIDEERVVRLALAHVGGGAQSWFVRRMAKILGDNTRTPRRQG